MSHPRRSLLLPVVILIGFTLIPTSGQAGMGAVTVDEVATYLSLTQMTRERLQAISFFAAGILLSALIVQWLWNSLAKDFARLPRLTYSKALGLVLLWGLMFLLVLTMISGARELMTPGAWEKKGLLYELKSQPDASLSGTPAPTTPPGGNHAFDGQ